MSGPFNALKKWLGLQNGTSAIQSAEQRPQGSFQDFGSEAFPLPHGTDWAWRPEPWRRELACPEKDAVQHGERLGAELKCFHDCAQAEISLRQVSLSPPSGGVRYGLDVEVAKFGGSFMSLVLDFPAEALNGLQARHVIRLALTTEVPAPLEIFARLNIKHGPNTEQFVQHVTLAQTEVIAEFDLGYCTLNERRLEGVWVDVIFKDPEPRKITVQDLTLCRYPRAEL